MNEQERQVQDESFLLSLGIAPTPSAPTPTPLREPETEPFPPYPLAEAELEEIERLLTEGLMEAEAEALVFSGMVDTISAAYMRVVEENLEMRRWRRTGKAACWALGAALAMAAWMAYSLAGGAGAGAGGGIR